MIRHELLRDRGILTLAPKGPLQAADFGALAAVVDPYIEEHGGLNGLLIHSAKFPGWDDFAALLSHRRFVRDHHRKIRRIAVVSDSAVLAVAPKIANHFVRAEIRTFDTADRAAALDWLETG